MQQQSKAAPGRAPTAERRAPAPRPARPTPTQLRSLLCVALSVLATTCWPNHSWVPVSDASLLPTVRRLDVAGSTVRGRCEGISVLPDGAKDVAFTPSPLAWNGGRIVGATAHVGMLPDAYHQQPSGGAAPSSNGSGSSGDSRGDGGTVDAPVMQLRWQEAELLLGDGPAPLDREHDDTNDTKARNDDESIAFLFAASKGFVRRRFAFVQGWRWRGALVAGRDTVLTYGAAHETDVGGGHPAASVVLALLDPFDGSFAYSYVITLAVTANGGPAGQGSSAGALATTLRVTDALWVNDGSAHGAYLVVVHIASDAPSPSGSVALCGTALSTLPVHEASEAGGSGAAPTHEAWAVLHFQAPGDVDGVFGGSAHAAQDACPHVVRVAPLPHLPLLRSVAGAESELPVYRLRAHDYAPPPGLCAAELEMPAASPAAAADAERLLACLPQRVLLLAQSTATTTTTNATTSHTSWAVAALDTKRFSMVWQHSGTTVSSSGLDTIVSARGIVAVTVHSDGHNANGYVEARLWEWTAGDVLWHRRLVSGTLPVTQACPAVGVAAVSLRMDPAVIPAPTDDDIVSAIPQGPAAEMLAAPAEVRSRNERAASTAALMGVVHDDFTEVFMVTVSAVPGSDLTVGLPGTAAAQRLLAGGRVLPTASLAVLVRTGDGAPGAYLPDVPVASYQIDEHGKLLGVARLAPSGGPGATDGSAQQSLARCPSVDSFRVGSGNALGETQMCADLQPWSLPGMPTALSDDAEAAHLRYAAVVVFGFAVTGVEVPGGGGMSSMVAAAIAAGVAFAIVMLLGALVRPASRQLACMRWCPRCCGVKPGYSAMARAEEGYSDDDDDDDAHDHDRDNAGGAGEVGNGQGEVKGGDAGIEMTRV